MSRTKAPVQRAAKSTRAKSASAAKRPPVRKRRTQEQRSDEMRQRLVEAAVLVLRRKGYAGLRTDEVSRVAKVSRGAQQHHFPTKDSLVLATAAHVLKSSLDRGLTRAQNTSKQADPIDAIISDAVEFFLGPDFNVILDLVLAGSKDQRLRDEVYDMSRSSRLTVESAWVDVLCESGVPREKAESVMWLSISVVRGFAVRALWQRDEKLFQKLLDEWKLIIGSHLKTYTRTTR